MMTIISAFQMAGGIQVNRLLDANTIDCKMVFPGDPDWQEALASAGHFDQAPDVPPPTVDDLRFHATITKTEFLFGCMAAGLITPDEAKAAARGGIPASFQAAVSEMTGYEVDALEITWAGITRLDRMHPMIIRLASLAGVSNETLDEIFGITAQWGE